MAKPKIKKPDIPPLVPSANALRSINSHDAKPVASSDNYTVIDNWPDAVPITRDELDVLELHLGALLEETLQ